MKALSDALDTTLDNGLRVVIAQETDAPVAEVRLALPFAANHSSLAAPMELLAACVLRGTTELDRRGVSDRAADLGCVLGSTRDSDSLLLSASVLGDGLPEALALLADSVFGAAYRESEINAVTEVLMRTDREGASLRRSLLLHRFGEHPLCAAPAKVGDLLEVTTESLKTLHTKSIVPAEAVLLVLGPLEHEHALKLVLDTFGPWSGVASGLRQPPLVDLGRAGLVRRQETPSRVLTAGPGLAPTHPGHPALHLANLILGGSGSSRLFRHVREKHGLAYRVGSTLEDTAAGSWSTVDAVTGPGNGARAATEIAACMATFAETGPTATEVADARRFATGFARIGLSTRAEAASAATGFALRGLPVDWLRRYLARLDAVGPDEVAELARRHLDPAAHAFAVADNTKGSP